MYVTQTLRGQLTQYASKIIVPPQHRSTFDVKYITIMQKKKKITFKCSTLFEDGFHKQTEEFSPWPSEVFSIFVGAFVTGKGDIQQIGALSEFPSTKLSEGSCPHVPSADVDWSVCFCDNPLTVSFHNSCNFFYAQTFCKPSELKG